MAVELAELIATLRAELTEAMAAGKDADLKFEVGPVELELTVAVEKSGGASGKVRFWVLEMGADGKLGSTTTQRIKLTLDPRHADGARPDLPQGVKVVISGDEVADER